MKYLLLFCVFCGLLISCSSNTIRPPKDNWKDEINTAFFSFKYTRKIKTEIDDFKSDKGSYKQKLQRVGTWYLNQEEAEKMLQITLDIYRKDISSCKTDPTFLFLQPGFHQIYQNFPEENKRNAAIIQREIFKQYLDEERELPDTLRTELIHYFIAGLKQNSDSSTVREIEGILKSPESFPQERVCKFRESLAKFVHNAPPEEKSKFYRIYLIGSSLNLEKDIKPIQ